LSLPENVGFYDVTADGQRFLINTRTHLEQSAPLTVITDWRAEFRVPEAPPNQPIPKRSVRDGDDGAGFEPARHEPSGGWRRA
jgi:hypothetical protein